MDFCFILNFCNHSSSFSFGSMCWIFYQIYLKPMILLIFLFFLRIIDHFLPFYLSSCLDQYFYLKLLEIRFFFEIALNAHLFYFKLISLIICPWIHLPFENRHQEFYFLPLWFASVGCWVEFLFQVFHLKNFSLHSQWKINIVSAGSQHHLMNLLSLVQVCAFVY